MLPRSRDDSDEEEQSPYLFPVGPGSECPCGRTLEDMFLADHFEHAFRRIGEEVSFVEWVTRATTEFARGMEHVIRVFHARYEALQKQRLGSSKACAVGLGSKKALQSVLPTGFKVAKSMAGRRTFVLVPVSSVTGKIDVAAYRAAAGAGIGVDAVTCGMMPLDGAKATPFQRAVALVLLDFSVAAVYTSAVHHFTVAAIQELVGRIFLHSVAEEAGCWKKDVEDESGVVLSRLSMLLQYLTDVSSTLLTHPIRDLAKKECVLVAPDRRLDVESETAMQHLYVHFDARLVDALTTILTCLKHNGAIPASVRRGGSRRSPPAMSSLSADVDPADVAMYVSRGDIVRRGMCAAALYHGFCVGKTRIQGVDMVATRRPEALSAHIDAIRETAQNSNYYHFAVKFLIAAALKMPETMIGIKLVPSEATKCLVAEQLGALTHNGKDGAMCACLKCLLTCRPGDELA
jgi:hypothetical protein